MRFHVGPDVLLVDEAPALNKRDGYPDDHRSLYTFRVKSSRKTARPVSRK